MLDGLNQLLQIGYIQCDWRINMYLNFWLFQVFKRKNIPDEHHQFSIQLPWFKNCSSELFRKSKPILLHENPFEWLYVSNKKALLKFKHCLTNNNRKVFIYTEMKEKNFHRNVWHIDNMWCRLHHSLLILATTIYIFIRTQKFSVAQSEQFRCGGTNRLRLIFSAI